MAAFAFGLLHGLGFAGALAEVGLPENQIPTALLFFNVGVEIGQLLFVGAVLVLIALLGRQRSAHSGALSRGAFLPQASRAALRRRAGLSPHHGRAAAR